MPSSVKPAEANQSYGYFQLDVDANALFENNKIGLGDLPPNCEAFISRDGENSTPWLSVYSEDGDFQVGINCSISGLGPKAEIFSQNSTGSSSFNCHGNISDIEGHTFRSITDLFQIEGTTTHSSIISPLWKLDTLNGTQGALFLWSDSAADYAYIYAEGGGLFLVNPSSPDDQIVTDTILLAYAQPLEVSLTAYAGLATSADKGLYFTGVDVPALFDLTAFGRSLVDDTTAATARDTLELGSLVTQNITQTVTNSDVLVDSQITFIVPNGKSCFFSMVLFFECTNSANDPKYRVSCSAPPTVGRFKRAHLAGIAASQVQEIVDSDVILGFNAAGWATAELNGYIENSSGGSITVTLKVAENIAAPATSISLIKGSYCKYKAV